MAEDKSESPPKSKEDNSSLANSQPPGSLAKRTENLTRPSSSLVTEVDSRKAYKESRRRVGENMKHLFLDLDRRIANAIGFQGDILEEMRRWRNTRLHPYKIEQRPDRRVAHYVEGNSFYFSRKIGGTTATYEIGMLGNPKFSLGAPGQYFGLRVREEMTPEGMSKGDFPTDRSDFHFARSVISGGRTGEQGQTVEEETIETFALHTDIGRSMKVPSYEKVGAYMEVPMRVTEERRGLRATFVYGNIDSQGNVELLDNQYITVESPSSFDGKYNATTRSIEWQSTIPRSADEYPVGTYDPTTGTIVVRVKTPSESTEEIRIPLEGNIYERIRRVIQDAPFPQDPRWGSGLRLPETREALNVEDG